MMVTIQFPEPIAQRILRLPDRDAFVSRVVAIALGERPTEAKPSVSRSKWAKLASRVESDPEQLGENDYAKLRKDMRAFREDFHFKRGGAG